MIRNNFQSSVVILHSILLRCFGVILPTKIAKLSLFLNWCSARRLFARCLIKIWRQTETKTMVRGEGNVYVCPMHSPAQRGAILCPVSYPFPTTSAASSTSSVATLSQTLCVSQPHHVRQQQRRRASSSCSCYSRHRQDGEGRRVRARRTPAEEEARRRGRRSRRGALAAAAGHQERRYAAQGLARESQT